MVSETDRERAVREAAATGRPLADVVAGRDDVDLADLLGADPDVGEAGPQIDAVLTEHAHLTEGAR